MKFIDPDGREDIIFVKNTNPNYDKFESSALVYEDNTMTGNIWGRIKLGLLSTWGGMKKIFGSSLNKKDVKFFFGEPDKEFDDFSSLPNDSSTQGTVKAGEIYKYKREDFVGSSGNDVIAYLLWDEGLENNNRVPQDPNYNKGINPAYTDDRNYLTNAYIHAASAGNPNDPDYDSGSRGCLVRKEDVSLENIISTPQYMNILSKKAATLDM